MRATLGLFNVYFWRSIYGPIMAFLFPSVLLIILGNIMNIQYVLPGVISMAILFIGVLSMPLFIMEMKGSTLLKYVGASPVNTKRFTFSVLTYYLIIVVIAVFILLLVGMLAFMDDVFPKTEYWHDAANNVNVVTKKGGFTNGLYSGIFSPFGAFSFWIAILLHTALCLSTGLLISTFAKTAQKALTIGLIITIPSMFLSGMVLSVDIIAESDAMQWLSRMVPFRFSTGNIVVASTPLPQMGDYIQHLPYEDLHMIFKNVDPNGGAIYIDGERVTSVHRIAEYMNAYIERDGDLSTFYAANVAEQTIFDLIFLHDDIQGMASASNNIFNIVHSWGVNKLPDISQIEEFVKVYLGSVANANNLNSVALDELSVRIANDDFRWINNLFLTQPTTLYEIGDMVCNLVVPTVLTGAFTFTTIKKFKWSAR